MLKNLSLQIKISLVILFPFLILIVVSSILSITFVNKITRELSYRVLSESAKSEAAKMQSLVQEELYHITGLQYSVEHMFLNGERDREFYRNLVYNFFKILPEKVGGSMLVFEPNILDNDSDYAADPKYSPTKGQFTYYVSRGINNTVDFRPMMADEIASDYYTEPIRTGKVYITSIYDFELANKETVKMNTWALPIKNEGKVIGVITVDIFIDSINPLMENVKPFDGVETALIDQTGTLLYDSENQDNVGKFLYDSYSSYRGYDIIEKINSGEVTLFEAYNERLKEKVVYAFAPLRLDTGEYWGIKILVPDKIILKDAKFITNIILAINILMILVVCILTPLIIRKKVTNIIHYLSSDINKVSNGDISWYVSDAILSKNDEWGQIGKSFKNTLENLNNIVAVVKHSAEEVSTAANEVLKGNNDLSARTEMQASSLEETAASMNQMASAIKETTENVVLTSEMVTDAKTSIQKAGNIIEDSVDKMNAVNESSSKIMDITKLIEGIAFQTNILALNASVEAARAGDQGRGFAVVASEVRTLAQNTQESVKNITSLITDSYEKINLASKSVQQSKLIFDEITEKMDKASSIMERITVASQEENKGVEQVNIAISNMEISIEKNASLVEEARSASESLLNEANDLVNSIDYFKLR